MTKETRLLDGGERSSLSAYEYPTAREWWRDYHIRKELRELTEVAERNHDTESLPVEV